MTYPLSRVPLWRVTAIALGLESADATDAQARDDLAYAPPPHEDAAAASAVILVAEDNPTNQVVIRQLLSRMGLACDIAEHGMAALAMLDRGAHGLLLTDFNMPVMDGFALTRAVRAMEREKGLDRLPVIALTADAIAGTEDACLTAGMDGYLTKPIDSRKLGETLRRFLPQALPLRQAAAGEETVATEPMTEAPITRLNWDPDIFDPSVLAVSFGAFDAEAKSLVDSAALAWREKVATVLSAMAQGNTAMARDAAHALKGSALSVGAGRLGRLAGDVQDALDDKDPDTASLMAKVLEPTLTEFEDTLPAIRAA
jgi:CheY-like chemotaxis protein